MTDVRNPWLFNRLEELFNKVKVSNRGVSPSYRLVQRPSGKHLRVDSDGEQYNVCCPFCGDTRFRLTIPHTYGTTIHTRSGEKIQFPSAAWCFNETHCMDDKRKRRELKRTVLEGHPPILFQPEDNEGEEETTDEVVYPSKLVKLSSLSKDHRARWYLREKRRFDPLQLDKLGFRYCPEDDRKLVRERIFIPILNRYLELVGGQMRLPRDVDGKFPPKYFTLTDTRLGSVLFNFWRAQEEDTIVVTEGVFDALRAGKRGVASFNCHLTKQQRDKLLDRDMVIFAYDPGFKEDSTTRRSYEQRINQLRSAGVVVRELTLPDGKDPADMEESTLRQKIDALIEEAR